MRSLVAHESEGKASSKSTSVGSNEAIQKISQIGIVADNQEIINSSSIVSDTYQLQEAVNWTPYQTSTEESPIQAVWEKRRNESEEEITVGSRTWKRRKKGDSYEYSFENGSGSTMGVEFEFEWETREWYLERRIHVPEDEVKPPDPYEEVGLDESSLPDNEAGGWDPAKLFYEILRSQGISTNGLCNALSTLWLHDSLAPGEGKLGVTKGNLPAVINLKNILDRAVIFFQEQTDSSEISLRFLTFLRNSGIDEINLHTKLTVSPRSISEDFIEYLKETLQQPAAIGSFKIEMENDYVNLPPTVIDSWLETGITSPRLSIYDSFEAIFSMKFSKPREVVGHEFSATFNAEKKITKIFDQNTGLKSDKGVWGFDEINSFLTEHLYLVYLAEGRQIQNTSHLKITLTVNPL